jgi:hypothetical protein
MESYFEIIRNIGQEQVDDFCKCVNDWNPIHRPDYSTPMVPGMLTASLILENPQSMWRVAKMDHIFYAPLYTGKDCVYKYTVLHDRPTRKKYQIVVEQDNTICLKSVGLFVKRDE